MAQALGYIKENPTENRYLICLPKAIKPNVKPLTDQQVALFMKIVEQDKLALYFKVVLFAGLRESEGLGLTWDCVDFNKNILRIEKQLQKRPLADGGYVFAPLKNSKVRYLKMPPTIAEMLLKEWDHQAVLKCQAGSEWKGWTSEAERRRAYVFINEKGCHLTQSTVRRHYKKLAESILQAVVAVLIAAFLVGFVVSLKEGIVEEFLPNFLRCVLIVFAYFVVVVLTVNLLLWVLSLFM